MKKWIVRLLILAVLGGASYAGYIAFQSLPKEEATIATAKVRKGDVIVKSFARGELRAVRSATLTAPNLFGTVQVTRLAPLGAFAREKDLAVEFDDSEVQSRIEEKQLELDQIDEQIKKAQADLAIRNNQDQVELLQARYSVRRAELEVKRNELISAIDAQKNKLTLEEARRRLKQLESDIKSRQEQAQAELAVLREKRNKGNLEMARERSRLMQVKLLAPISGLVAVRQNRTGFMFPGAQVPDIREGDQIQPGIPVVDILDLSEMEIVAKVGELDRANLKEGQEAEMTLDALPEKKLKATIKTLSGTASANAFSFDPAKKFDVVFNIDMKELLGALGAKPEQISKILATAEANRKKNIVSIPAGGPMMMAGAMGGGGMAGAGGFGGQQGGGGAPGTMFQAPGGGNAGGAFAGGAGGAGGQRGSGGMGGMMGSLSPEDAQKMRDAMQKATGGKNISELSQEERQKVFSQMRDMMAQMQKKSGGSGRREAGSTPGDAAASAGGDQAGGGRRRGGNGGGAGGPGGFGGFGGGGQFSAKDLENAKLPPPPEEDTQFDVLLRPGLLADVQIIVEKIPNAVHIPMQAVFEVDGKPVVYVKKGNQFEPRVIKPFKRSENTMTISEGVQPGDVVALADPTAKKGGKGKEKDKGSGGAMGALPGGKS
jgi:multidrug efflux pump subunit AcrA (membrane-fusion protein)